MTRSYWDFRDVSLGFKKIRDFLIGRPHVLRGRFPPLVSPRSIPAAEIPRGPEYKYSNNYYHQRSSMHSIKPPVIAPVAAGPPISPGGSSLSANEICFHCIPKPGQVWWWDGHCYFEKDEQKPKPNPETGDGCPKADGGTSQKAKICGSNVELVTHPAASTATGSEDKPSKDFPIPFIYSSQQVTTVDSNIAERTPKNKGQGNISEDNKYNKDKE